jgi:hypothetical protein
VVVVVEDGFGGLVEGGEGSGLGVMVGSLWCWLVVWVGGWELVDGEKGAWGVVVRRMRGLRGV